MKVKTKILTSVVITGISVLVSTGASAGGWWDSDDDYWDRWGYPGYGWDGYPGYYGRGGYPGYGWGGYPGYGSGRYPSRIEIYTQPRRSASPQRSGTPQDYRIE